MRNVARLLFILTKYALIWFSVVKMSMKVIVYQMPWANICSILKVFIEITCKFFIHTVDICEKSNVALCKYYMSSAANLVLRTSRGLDKCPADIPTFSVCNYFCCPRLRTSAWYAPSSPAESDYLALSLLICHLLSSANREYHVFKLSQHQRCVS